MSAIALAGVIGIIAVIAVGGSEDTPADRVSSGRLPDRARDPVEKSTSVSLDVEHDTVSADPPGIVDHGVTEPTEPFPGADPPVAEVHGAAPRFTVVDGDGQPFAQAGVMAWPVGSSGGDGDGDGQRDDMVTTGVAPDGTVVLLGLDPDVEYEVTAFGIDTGWTCGYWTQPKTGEHFWFSEPRFGTPAAVDGTTLTVTEPNCTETTFTVLDADGRPFTRAGVQAQPVGGGPVITFANAGPDGTAALTGLDPHVEYEFTGSAIGTGWTCGYWTHPATGEHWWFSAAITGTPATAAGTPLIVTEPDCS